MILYQVAASAVPSLPDEFGEGVRVDASLLQLPQFYCLLEKRPAGLGLQDVPDERRDRKSVVHLVEYTR